MNFKEHILVALDLSSIDQSLIRYAHFLAENTAVKKVYFVHNVKKYQMSTWFEEEFEDVNLEQIIGDELQEKVDRYFSKDIPHEVLVSEDPNTESLINYIINKYSIDLALAGMKNSDQGAGVVGSKLLRLLKSDLIFVPENPPMKLEQILIGSDYSKNSVKSFLAMEVLKENFKSKLIAAHVFHVPFQFAVHVPKEKLIPKIEQQSKNRAGKFMKKLPNNLVDHSELLFAKELSVSQKLVAYLNKTKADMIVLSDRGANNYSTLLIGSLTEEIFDEELKVPFYVVK